MTHYLITSHDRGTWIRTLFPVGSGSDPIMVAEIANSLQVIAVDNSDLQVREGQRQAVLRLLEKDVHKPTILLMHYGLHIPSVHGAGGTKDSNKFKHVLCGSPKFGWEHDTGYQVERRQRWPRGGNDKSTVKFVDEILTKYAVGRGGGVIAILAGHEHLGRVDEVSAGCKQYVSLPGFEGGRREILVEDWRGVKNIGLT
eukprot:g16784.t1